MSYITKYLKYKSKYLKLKNMIGKGNTDYFNIFEFDKNTTFYHGSFNKIKEEFRLPIYFSPDPLQSVGHLLAISAKIMKDDYKVTDTDLNNITSCYPIIYQ